MTGLLPAAPPRLFHRTATTLGSAWVLGACIWRGARDAYPAADPIALARRLRFGCQAWWHRHDWRLLREAPASPALIDALQGRRGLFHLVAWPYIHRAWPIGQRVDIAVAHYQFVDMWRWLQVPLRARCVLMTLGDPSCRRTLQIDRPEWLAQEGELVLGLFEGEVRLYSLAFSLGWRNGSPVAYVGAIQGRSDPAIAGLYPGTTKALHGCRPRDLMVLALMFVAEALGMDTIYAVGEQHRRPHTRWWSGRADHGPSTHYDEIWTERGGVPTPDGFYALDTRFTERPAADIAANKRAMYRRRYALLGAMRDSIRRLASDNRVPPVLLYTAAQ
ncbi:MAG TPA: DUF535 family protein [Ideonella sp.]|nr:DUF535 family protein [Ideonella sp.]